MDNRNMSYVRKDSAMGKAALNAAGYTGRPFGVGVLFTFEGRSYRVTETTMENLQSYMGYEDITGKESLHSQEVGRIPRKPRAGVIVIHDFAEYAKRLRIARERGYRNPERWAATASNGIAMAAGDFERDHAPEPEAEASNATRPVNFSDVLAAALIAEAQNCDCGHCSPDPDFAEIDTSEITLKSYRDELDAVLRAVAAEGFDIEDGAAVSVQTAIRYLRAQLTEASKTFAALTRERDLARRDTAIHAENYKAVYKRATDLEGTVDRMCKAVKAEFDKADIIPF
jgi:hypothetical protein